MKTVPEADKAMPATRRSDLQGGVELGRRDTLLGIGLSGTALLGGAIFAGRADAGDARGHWRGFRNEPSWTPFELLTEAAMIVPVLVNGASTAAIVDSGSGATVISTLLASRLGLQVQERRRIHALTATAEVTLAYDVEVAVGAARCRLPFVIVADLALFSAGLGRRADLLLGADVLSSYALAVDFERRRLALAASGDFSGGVGWGALPLSTGSYRELLTTIKVAGRPVTVMVDMGSTAALMLSRPFAERYSVIGAARTSTAAMGGVDGIKIVVIFELEHATVGDAVVRSIPTIVPPTWLSESTDGNMGLPLLAQFSMVLDIGVKRLWLRPADRPLPMLKDRSGLGIAIAGDRLAVVHVAKGSPAEKSAWASGDQIVAVNGDPIDPSYSTGDRWRWRYRPQGMRVALRDQFGRTRTLTLADYF